jgi:hypothetical protein
MREVGRAALISLPKDSLILTCGDIELNSLRYVREVEGERQDVTHLDMNMISGVWFNNTHAKHTLSKVTFPGWVYGPIEGGYNMRQLLNANYKKFKKRVFLFGVFRTSYDPSTDNSWDLTACGVVDVGKWTSLFPCYYLPPVFS